MQRLVQEEAVKFLWNQVSNFSPLVFLLKYEFVIQISICLYMNLHYFLLQILKRQSIWFSLSNDDLSLIESYCCVVCYTDIVGEKNLQNISARMLVLLQKTKLWPVVRRKTKCKKS